MEYQLEVLCICWIDTRCLHAAHIFERHEHGAEGRNSRVDLSQYIQWFLSSQYVHKCYNELKAKYVNSM